MYNDIYFLYIQSGGSVGSTVVVTDVVGALVVVGGTVVGTGFASGGVKTQFSKYLNSISSTEALVLNAFQLLYFVKMTYDVYSTLMLKNQQLIELVFHCPKLVQL